MLYYIQKHLIEYVLVQDTILGVGTNNNLRHLLPDLEDKCK